MTLGWLVNGEIRHMLGDWGNCWSLTAMGTNTKKSVTPSATLAHPSLRFDTFTLSCAESYRRAYAVPPMLATTPCIINRQSRRGKRGDACYSTVSSIGEAWQEEGCCAM
jgi:hypothetical protein